MSVKIHPTAIISDGATFDENVSVGPYSIIGPNVKIGSGTIVKSHVVIEGDVEIGKNNTFFQVCSIGAPPQDTSYKNEPTKVKIGDNNTFRESCTVHRATTKENMMTIVGSGGLFMAYSHIAHDCVVGDGCIVVNSVNLAGHVKLGNRVILGGGTNVSQFVTIGTAGYLGGASAVDRDIPPYCTAIGNRVRLKGINIIGLRRMGHDRQVISEVVEFYRSMESSAFSPKSFIDNDKCMKDYKKNPVVMEIVESINVSKVGIAPFFMS